MGFRLFILCFSLTKLICLCARSSQTGCRLIYSVFIVLFTFYFPGHQQDLWVGGCEGLAELELIDIHSRKHYESAFMDIGIIYGVTNKSTFDLI